MEQVTSTVTCCDWCWDEIMNVYVVGLQNIMRHVIIGLAISFLLEHLSFQSGQEFTVREII